GWQRHTWHARSLTTADIGVLLLWALGQQFALQITLLREAQATTSRSAGVPVAALLFAALHLPNPFLTVVTFVAALTWCRIYDRYPNLVPVTLSHALLTIVVLTALDDTITGRLRVGIAFLRGAGRNSPTSMIRIIWVVLATLAVGIVSADRSAKAFAQHRSARASALLQSAQAARPAQQTVAPADLVLRNGTIVTVDEGKPEAQALAARGDTIVAVGSNQDIQPYIGASTKVIDLKGALATPGFIDAHVHFTGVGDAAKNLKLATP